ncbi:unnamed protein product [Ixodes pacificus]
METAKDFAALEKFLADENNFEYMVSHLKSFDGSTLRKKANGMMSGLFSLELAAIYNYKKRSTGKRVFVGTLAEKAVRRAAEESFPELWPENCTSHIGKWLRNAPGNLKIQEKANKPKKVRASKRARPEVVEDQA